MMESQPLSPVASGPRPSSGPHPSGSLVGPIAALLAVLGGVGVAAAGMDTSVALITAIAVALAIPLLWRVTQGRLDPFDTLIVVALAWGLMFVVRPTAMQVRNDFSYFYSPGIDLRQTFDEMLLLALLGAIFLGIGYMLPLGRALAQRLPHPPRNIRPDRVITAGIAVTAVGVALFTLFLLQVGGLGKLNLLLAGRSDQLSEALNLGSGYFSLGILLLIGPCLALYAVGRETKRVEATALAVAIALLTLPIFGPSGSRSALLQLFGTMIIYRYLSLGRRPSWTTLAVGLAVALLLSTIIVNTRNAAERERSGGTLAIAKRVIDRPTSAFDPITIGADAAMAPGLGAAIAVIPEQMPHTYGGSIAGDFLTRPVPRQLWADKPLPPRERVTRVLNAPGYESYDVNPEFSNLLLPYLDFGIFGTMILMAYGVAFRALYEWFMLHRGSAVAQVIYAVGLTMVIVALRDSPVDVAVRSLLLLAPIWWMFRVGGVRGPVADGVSAQAPGV